MTKEENEKRLEHLKGIVSNLPGKPGSYQYYDKDGTIIYVGKAKNLKNRVSSYFHKEVDRYKTKVLVSKIWDITYTVVNTEEDALLLENNLIKKYQPKYNILLKDGKTYPSIVITKEYYPRIFKTRVINKKFGTYYGPFSHIGTMYALLDIIKKVYKAPHLPTAAHGGGHQTEEIFSLSGLPHKELLRGVYRQTVARGIYEEHRAGTRNTERKHARGAENAL